MSSLSREMPPANSRSNSATRSGGATDLRLVVDMPGLLDGLRVQTIRPHVPLVRALLHGRPAFGRLLGGECLKRALLAHAVLKVEARVRPAIELGQQGGRAGHIRIGQVDDDPSARN